jgi:hypothetical protein
MAGFYRIFTECVSVIEIVLRISRGIDREISGKIYPEGLSQNQKKCMRRLILAQVAGDDEKHILPQLGCQLNAPG